MDLLRLLTRDELEGSGLVNVQFANASDAIFASEDVPPRKIENISVVIVEQEFVGSILGISATRSSTEDGGMDVELAGRGVEFLANLMRSSEVQEINLIGKDLFANGGRILLVPQTSKNIMRLI